MPRDCISEQFLVIPLIFLSVIERPKTVQELWELCRTGQPKPENQPGGPRADA